VKKHFNFEEIEFVCIDATYKSNDLDFPVVVMGTVDCNESFVLIGICICKHETQEEYTWIFENLKSYSIQNEKIFKPKFIMADAALSITSAVKNSFPDSTRLFCWFHTIINLKKKYSAILNPMQTYIKSYIKWIQLRNCKDLFLTAVTLFLKKYEQFDYLKAFIDYFKENWVDKNSLWYEGSAPFFPSTNNALERFNLKLKNDHFNWEKYNLKESIEKFAKIMENSSAEIPCLNYCLRKTKISNINVDEFVIGERREISEYIYIPIIRKSEFDKDDDKSIQKILSEACAQMDPQFK
jgi:hypothetical protein